MYNPNRIRETQVVASFSYEPISGVPQVSMRPSDIKYAPVEVPIIKREYLHSRLCFSIPNVKESFMSRLLRRPRVFNAASGRESV